VSIQIASALVGLVLGWSAVPRLRAPAHIWLLHIIGLIAVVALAGQLSPLISDFACAGAATGFALRALMCAALYQRRVG
jgi:hypothetical protein